MEGEQTKMDRRRRRAAVEALFAAADDGGFDGDLAAIDRLNAQAREVVGPAPSDSSDPRASSGARGDR